MALKKWLTSWGVWQQSSRAPRRRSGKTRVRALPRAEGLEDRTLLDATPVPLGQEGLHLGVIASTAVSPDGHKVYLGRRWSYDHGETNLVVVTLDASGKPVGDPHLYADSAVPLPFGGLSTVNAVQ